MIVPNPFYRLNPSRAVYINGVINSDLISQVIPVIHQLQTASREPITVYIDSPGGSVYAMEVLLRLLKLSDQDSASPCHLITAVTNRAASAAADLLSSGDYAIAYPTASVLYHGTRRQEAEPLTRESTSMLAHFLRISNDRYAMELARKIEDRFSFRFIMARPEFAGIRAAKAEQMTDLECFVDYIDSKLSYNAKRVWAKAQQRHHRYDDLFNTVIKQFMRRRPGAIERRAQMEAHSIKAIVDFELKAHRNEPDWTFRHGGLETLADDFFLFDEYLSGLGHERLTKWVDSLWKWVLSAEEILEIEAIADEGERKKKLTDKVRPQLTPLWAFFVALCHALQDGENELTAEDAFWLGLVDEVMASNLMSVRTWVEFQPDLPPDAAAAPAEAVADIPKEQAPSPFPDEAAGV